MTKYAFISDIHSNIDALKSVESDMEKRGVDKIICLGDFLTKYVNPKETMNEIRNICEEILIGNCDFNVYMDDRFKLARSAIGEENLEFIGEQLYKQTGIVKVPGKLQTASQTRIKLKPQVQLEVAELLLNLYHATPDYLDAIFNPVSEFVADPNRTVLSEYKGMFIPVKPEQESLTNVVLTGHTHVPYLGYEDEKGFTIIKDQIMELTPNRRYIINVGSVGDPNIRNPFLKPEEAIKRDTTENFLIDECMSYVILDVPSDDLKNMHNATAELVRVPYRDVLIKVYNKFIFAQRPILPVKEGEKAIRVYPDSPKDTKKIHDSLVNIMGVNPENIHDIEDRNIPIIRGR